MKNSSFWIAACLYSFVLISCSKDNDFKMSVADFAHRSIPLIAYSRALDSAVLMRSTDPLLLSMVKSVWISTAVTLTKINNVDPSGGIQVVFSAVEQDNIYNITQASEVQIRNE